MSWAGLAFNQTVSFNNLQNAVSTGVFTAKTSIPASNEQITKADANTYVNINTSFGPYASKSSNQLVVKSNLISLGSQAFVGFTSEVSRILSVTLRSAGVSISPLIDLTSGGCSIPSITANISPTTTTTVNCELRFRSAPFSEFYTGYVKAYNLSSGALVFNQSVSVDIDPPGSSIFVNITGLTVGVPFYYEVIISSSNCPAFPDPMVV
jgi:hypothetical protein